jgi:transcriptional regulator with XRE-family HTH domain
MALTRFGELLKDARLRKNLRLEDVEKVTKIRTKFLAALEDGKPSAFQSTPYARGFLKNYAEFLGLDIKLVLALFRRETEQSNVKVLPSGMVGNESKWFRMTPTRALFLITFLIVASIGYYLFGEYRGFLGAPTLIVEKPLEGAVVKEGEIEITGKADIDSTIVINTEPVSLSETGSFTKTMKVFRGDAIIVISAKNRRGKVTTLTRHIKVE